MNSWRETIEQPKPKPERTKPHPQKLWKKAAKSYWRWRTNITAIPAFRGDNLLLGNGSFFRLQDEVHRRLVSASAPLGTKRMSIRMIGTPDENNVMHWEKSHGLFYRE